MILVERYIILAGKSVSWLSLFLVVVMCLDVLLRYGFSTSNTWMIDLEWQGFSLLFLLSGGATLLADKHVRVDLFYAGWSERVKSLIDLFGGLFLLIPWCAMMVWTHWNYVSVSWAIGEGSPDPNGLPARYLIKTGMLIGFLLLLLAALVKTIHAVRLITAGNKTT